MGLFPSTAKFTQVINQLHNQLIEQGLMRGFLSVAMALSFCLHASALEVQIPNVQQTLKHMEQHDQAPSIQHLQWLLESKILENSKEAGHLFNRHVIQHAQHVRVHLADNPERWYAQMRMLNRGRLLAWWQDRLEGMQRQVPGLGIEADGMRFQHQKNWVHIMGRAVEALPQTQEPANINADILIQSALLSGALELNFKKNGLNARMYGPKRAGQALIDKSFLEQLPQELFAWTVFHINDDNRDLVSALLHELEDVLQVSASERMLMHVKEIVSQLNGEVLLGFTNIDHEFEFVVACTERTDIMKSIHAFVGKERKELFVENGNGRLVLSHNVRIARQLSGQQEVSFPQHLPEQISKQEQLATAAYIDTITLAQLYYKALPMLRHYSDNIGTQEFNILRNSLREMLPQSQSMVLTAHFADDQYVLEAKHIGQASIIGLGMSLCYRYAASDQNTEAQFVLQAFEHVQQQRSKEKAWPQRMSFIKSAQDLCYLEPLEYSDFDLPVIIENPARHGGAGSFVVFSNGKHKFFAGREIWNQAQQLAKRSGTSYWQDWQLQEQQFRPMQDSSRRVSLESEQMRQLFEILHNQEAGR